MKDACPRCGRSQGLTRERLEGPVHVASCSTCGATLVFLKRPAPAGAAPSSAGGRAGAPSAGSSQLEEKGSRDRLLAWGAGLLVVGLIVGIGGFILHTIKSSDAYRTARSFVRQNEKMRSLIGPEMGFHWFPEGEIQGDRAAFELDVSGTRGEAVVVVRLVRRDTAWTPVEAAYRANGERGRLAVPGGQGRSSGTGAVDRVERLLEEDRVEEALTLIARTVEREPGNAEARYWHGRALWRADRRDSAESALRRALELRPNYLNALQYLGYVLNVTGRHAEAVEVTSRALRQDSADAFSYYHRARARYELGHQERALEDARQSCDLGYERGCDAHRYISKREP